MSETGFDIPDYKKIRVIVDTDAPAIRLYTDVDSRYILEDLITKLQLFCEEDG